ncbi:hypothetical protein [Methylobacterium sp. Leaf123]|uniref:hypothetical protein n=1 Tax=Methylobacterium sp. Leaf123 TaxID=1736264 RepID=UPI0009EA68EB|nr:hypothetical protein [Methylobacterium sp. Leaf123]
MTPTAAQARHLSLMRLEQAAGQAFGYTEAPTREPKLTSSALVSSIVIALGASAMAATISYLI